MSYRWICELADLHIDPMKMGERLTFAGLELDGIEAAHTGMEGIVIAEVLSKKEHPTRETLSIVEVDGGAGPLQVVCGAPNCPGPGGRVVLANLGAKLGRGSGAFTIEPRKLGGEESAGMLLSEHELDLGPDHDGIIILNGATDAAPGTPIVKALDLEDWILEVAITPNRPDALSHLGIAREVALLEGVPFAPKRYLPAREGGIPASELASVEILEAESCPRYGAAIVTDVHVGKSPFAMRVRLHRLGIRPISNIVDMTNWILLEFGQPLHAFDLDLLEGRKIIVRKAESKEKFLALDGIERELDASDLLIADEKRGVAIAGVMGGEDTGVTEKTKNILIECAYFNPSDIRRTSKKLRLSSESSYRFERGIDPNMGPRVLEAATSLTQDIAGGMRAPGIIDCYPNPIANRSVTLRPKRFTAIMGFEVASSRMREILNGLGADVAGPDDALQVRVPTSRPDIEREVDLIEEIARIDGYDKIPTELPRIRTSRPRRVEFEAIRRAKELLKSLGLDEAITYSFVAQSQLAELGADEETILIANPLNAERSTMRTTLVAGLLENLERATKRFETGLKQFEIGRTFHASAEDEELPCEVVRAAGILSGPAATWIGEQPRQLDFYDCKGVVDRFVFEFTGVKAEYRVGEIVSGMHPKRTLDIWVADANIGYFGELHPSILEARKIPRGASVFELNLLALGDYKRIPKVEGILEYPPIVRDIALLVSETQDSEPIGQALRQAVGSLATEVKLFDVYRGKGIPEGKKSLAFSVVYRAGDRTLTDSEVDALHTRAVESVVETFSAVRR